MVLNDKENFREALTLELPNIARNFSRTAAIPFQDLNTDDQDLSFSFNANLAYIPDHASDKEKRIHKFLDRFHINTVNVKMMIEDSSKGISPKLNVELQSQKKCGSSLFKRRQDLGMNPSPNFSKSLQVLNLNDKQTNIEENNELSFGMAVKIT